LVVRDFCLFAEELAPPAMEGFFALEWVVAVIGRLSRERVFFIEVLGCGWLPRSEARPRRSLPPFRTNQLGVLRLSSDHLSKA